MVSELVRVGGVEPPSHPWEGYIIAVIRHSLTCVKNVADPTRLELATSAVTGRRSNQLSYESTICF